MMRTFFLLKDDAGDAGDVGDVDLQGTQTHSDDPQDVPQCKGNNLGLSRSRRSLSVNDIATRGNPVVGNFGYCHISVTTKAGTMIIHTTHLNDHGTTLCDSFEAKRGSVNAKRRGPQGFVGGVSRVLWR